MTVIPYFFLWTVLLVVGVHSQFEIEPEMKVMDQFVFTVTSALLADSLENSHPISNPVGNPEDIAEIFDAISYSKGASLLRMINHFLTENTFKKGVSNYLRKYAYSDAEQDHLWQYLTDQAVLDKTLPINVTVKEIMDTWTLQMGFPVVTVVINADGTATLTQERFLKYKKQNISDFSEYKWWIPITYSFESNPDFTKTNPKEWMSPSETTKVISGLPSKDQWFVFNNILAGFYRVNYELDNWQRIIKQFNIDHKVFPTITRAQLIGDAFQLARGGLLDYTIPLSLILYLKREKELVPLKTAISASSFLRSTMKYTEYEDLINNFTLALLAPHYDKYGFKISPTDTYMDKSIRSALLYVVCRLDYEPCINNAVELYQEWMNDPTNESIIAPNIQSLVYCIGIKKGGQREWDFAWEQYRHLKLVSQKEYILSALGCTLNETLRLEYLNIMFKKDSPVRKQNVGRSFGSICRDKEGHILAWNYLRQNWNKISEHLGSKLKMIGFIRAASGFVKNYKQLAEVDNFIESREDLEGVGTRSLEQMRENIVGSIKWLEENLELVGQWLLKQEVDRSVKT